MMTVESNKEQLSGYNFEQDKSFDEIPGLKQYLRSMYEELKKEVCNEKDSKKTDINIA